MRNSITVRLPEDLAAGSKMPLERQASLAAESSANSSNLPAEGKSGHSCNFLGQLRAGATCPLARDSPGDDWTSRQIASGIDLTLYT